MMEMEMNADLGDDVGSESSQASSEGSSASGTFCNLEEDYARIIKEMKTNEALAPYEAEYTRLYECLYKAHKKEGELQLECTTLKDEIEENTRIVTELTGIVETNAREIAKLKEDIVTEMKLADAAHTREQNAQEVIETLRLNVKKLNQELEHKNKELAAQEDTVISKQKEGMLKERERLIGELDTIKQRLKNMSLYTEELEKKHSVADHQMNEMQETLDMQLNEISKEKRGRERAEAEVEQLQEELAIKINDLEAANATIKTAASNVAKLQSSLKEERMAAEKAQKDLSKAMVKRMNLQTDLDTANVQIEELEKELSEKDKFLRTTRQDINKGRDEITKVKSEKDAIEKKLLKVDADRARLAEELKQCRTEVKNAGYEMQTLRKRQADEKQRMEVLTREKNMLAQHKEIAADQIKRLHHELMVCDQSRKKIERELDDTLEISIDLKKQLEAIGKERDRYSLEVQELTNQVEDYIGEVKLKQVEIFDYKKRLAEAEAKHRQQQNLFETVRAERNSYSKSLMEAHEEIQDHKGKLKTMSQQIEQLKEDIATKEADLIKKEFLLGRLEREKESLKADLQSVRDDVSNLRREIEEMKREEKRLRQLIQQADMDIARQKKAIDNVMNERDILGTQLVRRNDELGLQYSKIKVLNGTVQRGEAQYSQRLEDIRLLKLEVKKLRTEKVLLTKSIANTSDLRQEIFHLDRDLTRERLKVMALEEEVQTPLNIHRWRKLEGTDPSTFELLQKMQILQKRVIRMGASMVSKEKKIRDTEKLYMNLREILSKHPGPQVAVSLEKTQKALRERGNKMKCLVSELNAYEAQMNEYRMDMETMAKEMSELKAKYYSQKRKLQKARGSEVKSMSEPILPPVSRPKTFCGGGFRMATPTPRNCYTLDSASR